MPLARWKLIIIIVSTVTALVVAGAVALRDFRAATAHGKVTPDRDEMFKQFENEGRLAGEELIRRGQPVLHYQGLGISQELGSAVATICRKKYGFDFQGGYTCVHGSEDNLRLEASDNVCSEWLEKHYGRPASDLIGECFDAACVEKYGMDYKSYKDSLSHKEVGSGMSGSNNPVGSETHAEAR